MRRMLVSRSSLLNPRPLERLVRTSSPSNTSTLRRRWPSSLTRAVVSVVFPAPDNPVIHKVNPFRCDIIPPICVAAPRWPPVRLRSLADNQPTIIQRGAGPRRASPTDKPRSAPLRLPAARIQPVAIDRHLTAHALWYRKVLSD